MTKKIKILPFLLVFCSVFFAVKITQAADWQSAAIDSDGDVGTFNSVAIDSNGKLHISYYDNTNDDLKYATNISGSWVTEVVDSAGNVGGYASIAVDSNNKVHISYFDSTNFDLKYATNSSGAWASVIVDNTSVITGVGTAIAVDSNNAVHIAYYDFANTDLRYATNTSGSWVLSIIDSTEMTGGAPSIAIDSNNFAHISYYDITNSKVKYATNALGAWTNLTVDNNPVSSGIYSSIDIDSNNKVHIAYYESTNDDLKYATNTSGIFTLTTIDTVGEVGLYVSLKLDSSNKVHISYYDTTNDDLKYATNTSGSWASTVIDAADDMGLYTATAIDAQNHTYVSYYDNTGDNLKYAYTPGPSSGSISVNSGDAYTVSRNVNLSLSAQGSPTEMIVSENSDFTGAVWETYYASKSFTLSSGQGAKTVYVKFRDQWYAESNMASDAINYLTKPKFVTKNQKNLEVLVNKKNQEYEAPDLTFLFSKLPSKFLSKKYYVQMQKRAKYMKKYGQDKNSTLKKYWRFESNFNKYQPKSSKNDFKIDIVFQYSNSEVAALKKVDKNIKEKDLFLLRYSFSKKTWEKIMTDHSKKNNTFTLSGLKPSDFSDEFYYFAIGKK